MRRLAPKRFIEVPDAVSCFAGVISVNTGIPYITVRETPKTGRVSKAKTVGAGKFGETAAILDDVITNGASKLVPYAEALAMGLKLLPLIVLVDRQQGWKQDFAKLGINLSVWAGMNLHDIRKYLISNGIMARCDKELEEKNPIIVALDGKNWETILPLIDQLRTSGCILKVNDLLFNEGMKKLIPDLQVYGRVMADLKAHDIPNTVENIVRHILPNPTWAVTVHASGGEKMIKAAVNILSGTKTMVLAVTVLTSIDEKNGKEIYSRLPFDQVKRLAKIAYRAGAHGLVCSPEESGYLKGNFPEMKIVTPGVRSPGADKGDQERVNTPAAARENGSDFQVMGRQILGAPDPVAEVKRVLSEELKIV